jgi:hexosaminidase
MELSVDMTAPDFTLLGGGGAVVNGAIWEDSQSIILNLQTSDGLSGVASQKLTIDGQPYQKAAPLDWAGHLGYHTVEVWVEDSAGNHKQETLIIQVTTSPSSILQLITTYEASGALEHAIASQLRNNMNQAIHYRDAGQMEQALKSLEDFKKHLEKKAVDNQVSSKVKEILKTDIEALLLI